MAEETDVTMTPVTSAEAGEPPKVSPFGAVAAPASAAPAPAAPAPAAPASGTSAPPASNHAPAAAAAPSTPSTIRLKPVIRKPMIRKPMAPAARPPAAPVAKTATANLKSVTGPIPAQAVLKKTGIVAEGILTPAQAQAAKSKTSRISLESAIGVAPAKEAPAPLKTIRLRRPADLKPGGASPISPVGTTKVHKPDDLKPSAAESEKTEPTVPTLTPVSPDEASTEAPTETDAGVTQKKTLKLRRPGATIKKPTLGVKRPTADAEGDGEIKDIPPADIGDVPELKPLTAADLASAPVKETSAGVPNWVMTISLVTTIAALAVIGFVTFLLVQEGCGPDAGANAMAFILSN